MWSPPASLIRAFHRSAGGTPGRWSRNTSTKPVLLLLHGATMLFAVVPLCATRPRLGLCHRRPSTLTARHCRYSAVLPSGSSSLHP